MEISNYIFSFLSHFLGNHWNCFTHLMTSRTIHIPYS